MDGPEQDKKTLLQIDLNALDLNSLLRKGRKINIGGLDLTGEDLEAARLVSSAQTGSQVVRDKEFEEQVKEAKRHLQERGLQADLVTLYPPILDLSELVGQLRTEGVRYNNTDRGVEVFGPHAKIDILKTVKKIDITTGHQPIRQEFTRIRLQVSNQNK